MVYLLAALRQSPSPDRFNFVANMMLLSGFLALSQHEAAVVTAVGFSPLVLSFAVWMLCNALARSREIWFERRGHSLSEQRLYATMTLLCTAALVIWIGLGGSDSSFMLLFCAKHLITAVAFMLLLQFSPEDSARLPVCWARYPGWTQHAVWFFAMSYLLRGALAAYIAVSGEAFAFVLFMAIYEPALQKLTHCAFLLLMWAKRIDHEQEDS